MGEEAETKPEELSEQKRIELKEKLNEIDKRLLTMEWDKRHNQLNAGMEEKYTELKTEHDKLLAQINGD
ncbi:hypothetical protein CMO88_04590 [Candidatus Woesearchaeota archaeon]|nr:hypothetical protein [Candidatus Woesearchaeota archaeon]|tara:strand:- start:2680 stop:2886 length:207 start_codon:yes stop_codon:yes gene_type:complete